MNAPHSDQHLLSVAAMDMIRQLVAFDTTSRESNLALIDWVRQYLHAYGIDSRLTFDDARRKANLFATVGPKRDGGCIVGEPTGMELVVAHKGKRAYRCRVRGFEAHSALTPRGVNAVEIACELVTHLRSMALRFRREGRFDNDYDVPFNTVHVGTIKGGTALNIVPRDCEFVFEFRYLPHDDPARLLEEINGFAARFLPEMRAVAQDTNITFEELSALPGFDSGADSAIAELGRCCARGTAFNKVSFGAEASLFHDAGIPAILCGPGHIAQAHQPNEWVAIEQLARCDAFLRRLIDEVAVAEN